VGRLAFCEGFDLGCAFFQHFLHVCHSLLAFGLCYYQVFDLGSVAFHDFLDSLQALFQRVVTVALAAALYSSVAGTATANYLSLPILEGNDILGPSPCASGISKLSVEPLCFQMVEFLAICWFVEKIVAVEGKELSRGADAGVRVFILD